MSLEPKIITIKAFKSIISGLNMFNAKEIEGLMNPICLPFITFDRLSYEKFLKFDLFYKKEI